MMYERLTARQISQKDRISLSVVNLTTLAYRIKREDFHVARQTVGYQLVIAIWLSEKTSTSRVITYLPTDSWISPASPLLRI